MDGRPARRAVARLITIPSDDAAFERYVQRVAERDGSAGPEALQDALRRLFPLVTVRPRDISGEPAAWYVYRDGRWREPAEPRWWSRPGVPMLVLDGDGWVVTTNAPMRSLLGMDPGEVHHYGDFVVPGTSLDAADVFHLVRDGHAFEATVRIRPIGGRTVTCELRAEPGAAGMTAWLRLASDAGGGDAVAAPPPPLRCEPASDPLFAGYAGRHLARLPEPTAEALALRLRRLYPRAVVEPGPEGLVARRDGDAPPAGAAAPQPVTPWWQAETLPRVRYDAQGLILEANEAAVRMLGGALVGRHWQELVTPGAHDQVAPILALIREAGEAVSRFRIPVADGPWLEVDSWTRAQEDEFETRMRPAEP